MVTVSEPAAFDVAVIEVDSKLGVVTSETTILVAEVESAGDLDLNGAVEIDYEDGTATDTADIQEVNLTFEDVPEPDDSDDSGENTEEGDGSDAGGDGSTAGSDETVERETFGVAPSVRILGIGAVFVAVVLGLTVVFRRDDSSQERL